MSHNKLLNNSIVIVSVLALVAGVAGIWGRYSPALAARLRPEVGVPVETNAELILTAQADEETAQSTDPLVLSYAAKFVCLEPLQPGQFSFGAVAPLVKEATKVLIHNPHDFAVTLYKKAVLARFEDDPPIEPGGFRRVALGPDHAFQIDCDDITRLLTGNPTATFIGTYGIGVEVEGFVVLEIGPQVVPGQNIARYAPLDVTAEYARSSEVMKKDVHYQPWWWWWWWNLPWRLGYAYQRVLPITDLTSNIDCREVLYSALHQDVNRHIQDPTLANLTHQALSVGQNIDPTKPTANSDAPGLVALIGRCDKIDTANMSVDYVLMSNKGSTDPDPRTPPGEQPEAILYPWVPGRWYDLPVVMPQNITHDMDQYFRQWHSQRWIDAGGDPATVNAAMAYYFPYWCGWGYWWWWWNAGDCVDIAMGEGESLDVNQITPQRVFMAQWPPIP